MKISRSDIELLRELIDPNLPSHDQARELVRLRQVIEEANRIENNHRRSGSLGSGLARAALVLTVLSPLAFIQPSATDQEPKADTSVERKEANPIVPIPTLHRPVQPIPVQIPDNDPK